MDAFVYHLTGQLADATGGYAVSRLGLNHGYISLHEDRMPNHATVKVTVGHEFFHLVQSLNDGRDVTAFRRAQFPPPHHWFNEACSVWSEVRFSNNPELWPHLQQFRPLMPYQGLFQSVADSAEAAGYGNAAMAKYLATRPGHDLQRVYAGLKEHGLLMTALTSEYGHMRDWWGDYLKEYADGNLFPMDSTTLFLGSQASFTIDDQSGLEFTDTANYSDFSGHFYRVELQREFDEGTTLDLTTSGTTGHIHVFRSDPSGLVHLASSSSGQLSLPGLRDLRIAGRRLLVLVTHEPGVFPYLSSVSGTLTGRVVAPLVDLTGLDKVYVYVGVEAQRLLDNGTLEDFTHVYSSIGINNVQFNGQDFSATFDLLHDHSFFEDHLVGSLAGTLSSNRTLVESVTFEITSTHIHSDGSTQPYYFTTFTLENLPMTDNYPSAVTYQAFGQDAFTAITNLEYNFLLNNWSLVGYSAQEYSQVRVTFQE